MMQRVQLEIVGIILWDFQKLSQSFIMNKTKSLSVSNFICSNAYDWRTDSINWSMRERRIEEVNGREAMNLKLRETAALKSWKKNHLV